jgi:hypothetical protein
VFSEAVDYWLNSGAPDLMDADRDGIPCETVYPSSEVAGYLDDLAAVTVGDVFPPALSRDLIPWSAVGPGWYLASFLGSDAYGQSAPLPERPAVLYLLNDRGIIYELASEPPGTWVSIHDWSPDGQRALLQVGRYEAEQAAWWEEVRLLDLRTLESSVIERWDAMTSAFNRRYQFTKPTGKHLVKYTHDWEGNTETLSRLTSGGELITVVAEQTSEFESLGWLYRYDGMGIILSDEQGLREVGVDGRHRRSIWTPDGMNCAPSSWWDSDTIVVACTSDDPEVMPHEHFAEVWLLDLDGRTGRSITHSQTEDAWDIENAIQYYGAGDVWATDDGLLVSHSADCSALWVDRIDESGTYLGTMPGHQLIGVNDSIAVMLTWQACDQTPGSLIAASTGGDYLYDLIRANDPIFGVFGNVGSLASQYP